MHTYDCDSVLANHERRILDIRRFSLFSDVFMSEVFKDIPACQFVLRALTGKRDLILRNVKTQYEISKAASRGVRLDVIAEDTEDILYNLEIQCSDTVDHPRRLRLYSALIDGEILEKGSEYAALPELYLFYISETDILRKGKTVYTSEKHFDETNDSYQDGIHIRYVNAEADDGSEIATLMRYFRTADPDDLSQGALSERVHYLKCEEKGLEIMCEVTDKFIQEGIQYGINQGKQIGLRQGLQQGLQQGLKKGRKQGRKQGSSGKAREVTENLARIGMPANQIAAVVGESIETVNKWLKQEASLPENC